MVRRGCWRISIGAVLLVAVGLPGPRAAGGAPAGGAEVAVAPDGTGGPGSGWSVAYERVVPGPPADADRVFIRAVASK